VLVSGGSTDVVSYFQMRLLAGGDATGLTITDFDLSYTRSGDTTSAKADGVALAAANTAHTDNRGIEVDATDCPGLYRFDFPDAAFASGVREVLLTVKHTSCFTESLRVEINAAVNTVQFAGQTITAAAGVTIPSSIASPTNITAATGIVLSGVTHTGAVIPTVTTTTTATNLTNAPTSGDLTATMKTSVTTAATAATPIAASVTGNVGGNVVGTVASVVGAVGSVTGLTAANLDAAISSRMATYTQPTGFLAATFPATVASTTNITAGTITTVTGVTGLTTTTIADAVLSRNVSNVEASAAEHTLCTVVLAMLENSISNTTLTIKRTDGSTTHATKTLTVDAAADPITGIT